jgi:hypothetical protein
MEYLKPIDNNEFRWNTPEGKKWIGCMKDKSVGQSANGIRFQHCQFHQATCTSHNRLVQAALS